MWTDGRYHLQASQEMDGNWTLMKVSQHYIVDTLSCLPIRQGFSPAQTDLYA